MRASFRGPLLTVAFVVIVAPTALAKVSPELCNKHFGLLAKAYRAENSIAGRLKNYVQNGMKSPYKNELYLKKYYPDKDPHRLFGLASKIEDPTKLSPFKNPIAYAQHKGQDLVSRVFFGKPAAVTYRTNLAKGGLNIALNLPGEISNRVLRVASHNTRELRMPVQIAVDIGASAAGINILADKLGHVAEKYAQKTVKEKVLSGNAERDDSYIFRDVRYREIRKALYINLAALDADYKKKLADAKTQDEKAKLKDWYEDKKKAFRMGARELAGELTIDLNTYYMCQQKPEPQECSTNEAKASIERVMFSVLQYQETGVPLEKGLIPHSGFKTELADEQIEALKENFNAAYAKHQLIREYISGSDEGKKAVADPELRNVINQIVNTPFGKCLQDLKSKKVIDSDDLILLFQDEASWRHRFIQAEIMKVSMKEQVDVDAEGNPVFSPTREENLLNRRYWAIKENYKNMNKTETGRKQILGCLKVLVDKDALQTELEMSLSPDEKAARDTASKLPASADKLPRETPRGGGRPRGAAYPTP